MAIETIQVHQPFIDGPLKVLNQCLTRKRMPTNPRSCLRLHLHLHLPLQLIHRALGSQTTRFLLEPGRHIVNKNIEASAGLGARSSGGLAALEYAVRVLLLPGVRVLDLAEALLAVEGEAVLADLLAMLSELVELGLDALEAVGRRREGHGELVAPDFRKDGRGERCELGDG